MAWTKLSDDSWRSAKMRGITDAEGLLQLCVLSWLGDNYQTEGVIEASAFPTLFGVLQWSRQKFMRTANLLVARGLWDVEGDGFRAHSWLKHNRSAATIDAEREATRARVAEFRQRRGNAVTQPVTVADPGSGNAVSTVTPGPGPVPESEGREEAQPEAPVLLLEPSSSVGSDAGDEPSREKAQRLQREATASWAEKNREIAERMQRREA